MKSEIKFILSFEALNFKDEMLDESSVTGTADKCWNVQVKFSRKCLQFVANWVFEPVQLSRRNQAHNFVYSLNFTFDFKKVFRHLNLSVSMNFLQASIDVSFNDPVVHSKTF